MSNLGSILGRSAGTKPGELLKALYDPSTNTYFTVDITDREYYFPDTNNYFGPDFVDKLTQETRGMSKNISKMKVAIMDTGMLTRHPLIKRYLKDSINFSLDFDVEDHNGHGTYVTLIYLANAGIENDVESTELYNVKVLNALGNFQRQDHHFGLHVRFLGPPLHSFHGFFFNHIEFRNVSTPMSKLWHFI
jgi:hypothetical protein